MNVQRSIKYKTIKRYQYESVMCWYTVIIGGKSARTNPLVTLRRQPIGEEWETKSYRAWLCLITCALMTFAVSTGASWGETIPMVREEADVVQERAT